MGTTSPGPDLTIAAAANSNDLDILDLDNSKVPTVGNSNDSDDPDNPTMARNRAVAHVALGHNPNAVQNVTV